MDSTIKAWAENVRVSLNALMDQVDEIIEIASAQPKAEVETETNGIEEDDLVRIIKTDSLEQDEWVGLVARVIKVEEDSDLIYVSPLTSRPDGYGHASFYWMRDGMEKVRPTEGTVE